MPELSEHGKHKMRFSVSLHFQSLKAIENGGESVRRGNSELIRVSSGKSGDSAVIARDEAIF
jgi:hypothetical protein